MDVLETKISGNSKMLNQNKANINQNKAKLGQLRGDIDKNKAKLEEIEAKTATFVNTSIFQITTIFFSF